jgi:molecular chaperone DnaJ
MPDNFYVVLGVSSDAEPQQIRRAYRRLVKLYHPDVADEPVEKFHEIQQAYEALHDQQAHEHEERKEKKPYNPPGEPIVISRNSRRPRAVARSRVVGRTLEEETDGLFSRVDEFFDGWVPGLFSRTGLKATHRKNLYVELILDHNEAVAGGLFPLHVPTEQACFTCRGRGSMDGISCATCHGRGRSVSYHDIEVSVPPGVTDGTEARISLGDIGLAGVDLFVLISLRS